MQIVPISKAQARQRSGRAGAAFLMITAVNMSSHIPDQAPACILAHRIACAMLSC